MTAKTKILALAGVLAGGAILLMSTLSDETPPAQQQPELAATTTSETVPARAHASPEPEPAPVTVEAVRREEVEPPAPLATPTTGSLLLRAMYEDDGTPAADIELETRHLDVRSNGDPQRVYTDPQGIALVEDLAPGRVLVGANRHLGDCARDDRPAGRVANQSLRRNRSTAAAELEYECV